MPADLLACPPQPAPPADDADDATAMSWVLDGFTAGQACRDNLAAVKEIVQP